MFISQTIEDFEKGTLELWCPKMIVRQQNSDKPLEYTGSGLIRQIPDRQLNFVLIETTPYKFFENSGKAGKLWPENQYYSLEVTDQFGITWKAEQLLINPKSHFGPEGSIISGDIFVLEHAEQVKDSATTIHIEIFEDVAVPLDEVADKIVKVGCEDKHASILRKEARFSVGSFEFTLTKKDGILLIDAVSVKNELPQHFETRIIEALQYVTARTISWGILIKRVNESSTICLRSPSTNVLPAGLSLPIKYHPADYGGEWGKWVWLLFGKYLQHIWNFQGKNRFEMHPVSAWLNFVRGASTGSIFTMGLALGVAVEGILEAEFSDIGANSPEQTKALDELIAYVKLWEKKEESRERVRERVLSVLEFMRNPRAKDRLFALQDNGIIRKSDIDAWNRIRNKGAHARPPEKKEDTQKWLNDRFKIEVLLNHLIFRTIDYEGEFTDYSTDDWPPAMYPCISIAGAQLG